MMRAGMTLDKSKVCWDCGVKVGKPHGQTDYGRCDGYAEQGGYFVRPMSEVAPPSRDTPVAPTTPRWVFAAFRPDALHHLHHIAESGLVTAECGARFVSPSFIPPANSRLGECRRCSEHVCARDTRQPCPFCHKTPRKAACR